MRSDVWFGISLLFDKHVGTYFKELPSAEGAVAACVSNVKGDCTRLWCTQESDEECAIHLSSQGRQGAI